jgi:hypothetical protein
LSFEEPLLISRECAAQMLNATRKELLLCPLRGFSRADANWRQRARSHSSEVVERCYLPSIDPAAQRLVALVQPQEANSE